MAKKLTSNKAKEILTDGEVHGQPLTDKQKRFFGAIAGGAPIKPKSNGWLNKFDDGGDLLNPLERYHPNIPYTHDYTDLQYKKFKDFNNPRPPLKPIYGDNFDTYFNSFKPTGSRVEEIEGWVVTNPKKNTKTNFGGDKDHPPEIKPGQKLEWKKTSEEYPTYSPDRDFAMFFSKGLHERKNGGPIQENYNDASVSLPDGF
jgi:hypothetical protein